MMNILPIIISIVSLIISITLFIVSRYKELYRIGVGTNQVVLDEYTSSTSTDQNKQIMLIEMTFINESSSPFIITGLQITKYEFQIYDSDNGAMINRPISIKGVDKNTEILPIIIPPYSKFQGFFAFQQDWIYEQDHFIEIETPKRFLTFPLNPLPNSYTITNERRGRNRITRYNWKQNPIRTLQNKVLYPCYAAEKWMAERKIKAESKNTH